VRSAGTDAPGPNDLSATYPPLVPVSFGTPNSTLVTAQTGTTALIPCIVANIGDGVVSKNLGILLGFFFIRKIVLYVYFPNSREAHVAKFAATQPSWKPIGIHAIVGQCN